MALEYYAVHNQGGVPAILSGALSARPVAGQTGRLYVAAEGIIFRDTGSSWSALSGDDAASILAKLLTVDGTGSGLDADTLDGVNSTGFALAGDARFHTRNHNLFSSDHPDVNAADVPANAEVLTFNSTTGKWEAAPPGALTTPNATQAQADAGSDDTSFLTPLKVARLSNLAGEKRGLRYEYASASTYRVYPGAAWVPASGKVLRLTTAFTSAALTALTANTFYYIYGFDSGDGATLAIEHSVTEPTRPAAPTSPLGGVWIKGTDYTRVLLGCFMAFSATTMWRWQKDGDQYSWLFHTELAPFRTLNNASLTTTQAAFSVAAVVPVHSRTYLGQLLSGAGELAVDHPDLALTVGRSLYYLTGSAWTPVRVPTSAARSIQIKGRSATIAGNYLNATGFVEAI